MAYYITMECINEEFEYPKAITVKPGGNIPFNKVSIVSKTREDSGDFEYDYEKNLIKFNHLGKFAVMWLVRQQTGMLNDGHTFQLYKEDGQTIDTNKTPPVQKAITIGGESTQLKTTSTVGVAIVDKLFKLDEVSLGIKNVSKDSITLAPDSEIKAQIAIFGSADVDGEVAMIFKRLEHLEEITGGRINPLNPLDIPIEKKAKEDELIRRLQEVCYSLTDPQPSTPTHVPPSFNITQIVQSNVISTLDSNLNFIADELAYFIKPSEAFEQPYVFESGKHTGIPGCTMQVIFLDVDYHVVIFGAYDQSVAWNVLAENVRIRVYDEETETWFDTTEFEDRIYLWRSDPLRLSPSHNPWLALSWYKGDYTITAGWRNLVGIDSQELIPIYTDPTGIYLLLEDVEMMVLNDYLDFSLSILLSDEII